MRHLFKLGNAIFSQAARLPLFWLVAVAVVTTLIESKTHAQEVALPEATPSQQTTPAPAATPSPGSTVSPPQLIPPDVLPMPEPSALPGSEGAVPSIEQLDEELKAKPLSTAAENYRMQIEWRRLRNEAQNDATVKAARAAADRAHTDLEKRKLLAKYFNVFFDKMIAIGPPEMKRYLNARRLDHLRALPQPRVRPTSALSAITTKKGNSSDRFSGAFSSSILAAPSPSPTASASPFPTP